MISKLKNEVSESSDQPESQGTPSEKEAKLAELKDKILQQTQIVLDSERRTLEQTIPLGELLLEVKKTVGHGRWKQWLETETKIKPRTARDWIRKMRIGKGEIKASPVLNALESDLQKPDTMVTSSPVPSGDSKHSRTTSEHMLENLRRIVNESDDTSILTLIEKGVRDIQAQIVQRRTELESERAA